MTADQAASSLRARAPAADAADTLALRERIASLDRLLERLTSHLHLPTVLQVAVDAACELTGAQCGALAVLDESGRARQIVTYGNTSERRGRSGELLEALTRPETLAGDAEAPQRVTSPSVPASGGEGLEGAVWPEEVGSSPSLAGKGPGDRSAGKGPGDRSGAGRGAFRPSHPLARTTLSATLRYGEEALGALHLAERSGGGPFTLQDEMLLRIFAQKAAAVVRSARLFEALLASEERYRQLAEHARDLIMRLRLRPAPAYEYVNPAAFAITGYAPADFYADADLLLKIIHPDDRPLEETLRRSPDLPTGPITLRLVHKDGAAVWIEKRAVPVHDQNGDVTAIVSIARDITERKWVDEALQRRRAEVLAHVTQQVQTPLAAIKGSTALALEGEEPLAAARARQLFHLIDDQVDRLRQVMENLGDVARIDAGTLEVSPDTVDLAQLLGEVRGSFLLTHLHPLVLDIPRELPAVFADRRRIAQVLLTLLGRATAGAPPGASVAIAVEHNPVDVTLGVRGPGLRIASGLLGPVLQPFWPVDGEPGVAGPGAHLDIALCRGIVEAHQGRIWAEELAGAPGATVRFTLPVAQEAGSPPGAMAGAAVRDPGGARSRSAARSRILVVGQDPQGMRYLRRLLAEAGHDTIVADEPSQAMALLELEDPHLALVEVLPGAAGLEAVRSLRESSPVPLIVLSDDRDTDASVRALKAGADDFIRQPFAPAELLARIEAILRRRAPGEPAKVRPPFLAGDLALDFVQRRVTVAGEAVVLSATEYRLLRELAIEAGRVLTYDQLLTRVWGPSYLGSANLVRSFVRNLRRRLGDDAARPRYILTERQVGYRMASP